MLFDSTNLFSDDQAITASAASTNIIDLGATDTPKHAANAITRDIGKGTPVYVNVQVTAAISNAADDGTLQVSVQTDTVENFASATTLVSSAAVAEADLVAGYVFPLMAIPRGVERYLRLYYTVGGTGSLNAGTVHAGLVFAADARDV